MRNGLDGAMGSHREVEKGKDLIWLLLYSDTCWLLCGKQIRPVGVAVMGRGGRDKVVAVSHMGGETSWSGEKSGQTGDGLELESKRIASELDKGRARKDDREGSMMTYRFLSLTLPVAAAFTKLGNLESRCGKN